MTQVILLEGQRMNIIRTRTMIISVILAVISVLTWAGVEQASADPTGYVTPQGQHASAPVHLRGKSGYWTGSVTVSGKGARALKRSNARTWRAESKKRSDHGCKKVTVNNRYRSYFGSTSYLYRTWVHFCWSHGGVKSGHVLKPTRSWSVSQISSQQRFRGSVHTTAHFYYWSSAICCHQQRSGFKYYKQVSFENCPIKLGCVSATYPTNTIWVHGNGSWIVHWGGHS